ncbi:MAG: hypothetical protein SGILL_007897 [Bacillariaceae sp.]
MEYSTSATETPLDPEMLAQQSRQLRGGLEDFMERLRRFSNEDHVMESFEEDFCLLISQYPDECLQQAVLLTDWCLLEDAIVDDNNDSNNTNNTTSEATLRLPIHLACDNNAPVSIIRRLLEADVENKTILQPDKWGDLPIHTACSRNNFEVIQLLLEADVNKQTLHVKDVHESLPLHMAARYNAPKAVLDLLLENDPTKETLFVEGVYGQFPLTVACRGNASSEVLQTLLDYDEDKKSVFNIDRTGRLPIHVYLLRNRDRACTRLLLEGMVYGRIHRVGLDKWKRECQEMLASMKSTYERDFATRDKLDMIAEEMERFLQRAVLLELAVWKSSCVLGVRAYLTEASKGDESTAIPMKQILQTAEAMADEQSIKFSEEAFKKERHIKSGAEGIIPEVLSFLEDEPIERILNEFQSAGYLPAPEVETQNADAQEERN